MNRVWRSSLVVLVLTLALMFSVVPFTKSQERNPNYTYRYGCPVWEEEEKSYCPERYDSLISAKSNYSRAEAVRITLTDLKDFEYNVEKVEVHLKPMFEHSFNLYYTERDLGTIPRSKDEWTWVWDQKNEEGEQVEAGRLFVRVSFECCKNYRVYFRISRGGGGELEIPGTSEEEVGEVSLPVSPGGLSTQALSSREVRLTWNDNSDNEDGFRVYRNGTEIASVDANVTSYTDTGLEEGESYTYRVASFNDAGESALTGGRTVRVPYQVPDMPGSLSSKAMSPSKVRLTWNDNSDNEDGFRIYRNGTEIATVGANVTSYTDTGLEGETDYNYRVSSYNDGEESSLTEGLKITTPVEVSSAPGNMSSEILSPTEIRLSWADNSDNEDGFRVYRDGEKIAEVGPNTTSYVDAEVNENTSYTYRVSSFNEAGESSRSSGLNVTTPVKVPSSPGQLRTETVSPSEIELSWNDNSDNEDGFRIYRNGNRVATVGSNTSSYVHEDLTGETRYCYEVVAYNNSGESESSNRNCSITLKSLPDGPRNVNATPLSTSEIRLTWNDQSGNENGFKIYRNDVEIATVGPNTTSYVDTGLNPDKAYTYEVSAYNDSGESGSASSGTVTTPSVEGPEPTPEPEPQKPEPPLSQKQLIAGAGIVLMVMGYIYTEMS
ncbi:fibronectin type III domain-containing protein [Candidatus Bipolaricaulota bacterium]|nr:fibronectin type III domain-containing protein [Candidatus Bipolaricaulota bacterium]